MSTEAPDKPFYRHAREYGLSESDFTGSSQANCWTIRILTFTSTCRSALSASGACESARRCGSVRVASLAIAATKREIAARTRKRICGTSACVSCGACVDTCPTRRAGRQESILTPACQASGPERPAPIAAPDARWMSAPRRPACFRSSPVMEGPVNHGHLCVKGRYAFDFVSAPDRITTPMIRDGRRVAARSPGARPSPSSPRSSGESSTSTDRTA